MNTLTANTEQGNSIVSLSNGESNIKNVFQKAHFGFLMADHNFHIQWVNPAFSSFIGYSPEELSLLTFKDLTHPDQISTDLSNLKKIIRGELPAYNAEKRYVKKDGGIIWGSVTVLPIREKQGDRTRFLVMVEDISTRKHAEEEIMAWKNRYDLISRTSGQAVYEYDLPSGKITWGGNTHEVLGYKSKELGGIKNWEKFIHPADRRRAIHALEIALKNSQLYDCKYRFLHKSGHYLHIHDRGFFVNQDGKNDKVMIGMMQDYTDIIQVQKEVAEKEERYRTLFELSPSGIMLNDLKGNILDVNEAVCNILGYSKGELAGKHISMLVPASARVNIKKHIRTIEKGEEFEHEVIYIRKDAVLLNILLRETLIQLPNGRLGILAIINDITAKKKAEQSLKDSREQLQRYAHHLQTIREEERSRISRELHDHLGQYLSAIKMDASGIIIKLGKMNHNPEIDPVLNQARQLMEVIEEIIPAVRKIASDLHPRVLDELGLIPGIEWLVEEFIRRSGIQCRLVSSVEHINAGPAHAIAIFRIIQEALTNIVRHAKATKAMVLISENKKAIVVSIEDNGCGIKTTELSSMKSLGLIGMYERALLLGGELNFRKKGKKGTKVVLIVPKR